MKKKLIGIILAVLFTMSLVACSKADDGTTEAFVPRKQTKGGKKKVRPVSSGTELNYPVCSLDEIKEHLAQATSLCQGG